MTKEQALKSLRNNKYILSGFYLDETDERRKKVLADEIEALNIALKALAENIEKGGAND